jgi:NAD(P)H-dependent FMN reductase
MKVLTINGSPWMNAGNTAMILHPFLEGMRAAGADVEVVYTKNMQINFCQAEYQCQAKEPDHCFQDDEMRQLLPKLAEADIWVFATPIYADGVTAQLKNVMDRMLPLLEPGYEMRDGRSWYGRPKGIANGKVVLVASCGLWERDNFDPVLSHLRAYSASMRRRFAGALLRPHAGVIKPMLKMQADIGDIFTAAETAGQRLVRDGEMDDDALQTVSRELIALDDFVASANQMVEKFNQARA